MPRVRLTTRAAGTINADYADEWITGATTYAVTAPHVTGAFVISTDFLGAETIDPDTPRVCVEFGSRPNPTRTYYSSYEERPDLPRVYGVPLTGAPVVDTRKMRAGQLTGADMCVRRRTGPLTSTSAPRPTADRTAAVVHALLFHWLTRPENHALRLTAAALAADLFISERRTAIARRCETINTARGEIEELDDRADAVAALLEVPRPDGSTLADADPLWVGSSRRPGCAAAVATGDSGNPRPPTNPPPASPCQCPAGAGAHKPTCPAVAHHRASAALAAALDQLATAEAALGGIPAGGLRELRRLDRLCRRLADSTALARDVANYADEQADAHTHHTPGRTA